MGRIGDKGRGLDLLREPTGLECRFLGNMIVRDISIFEIGLMPARGRVMGRTEGKLSRRKR